MEILSTGEKIKRARIFKGITLKDLCGNKISISKMSCIENGKVKADKELLTYIADKIGIDLNYLTEDVYEQIYNNLEMIKKTISSDIECENKLKYNLEYCIKYEYYDLAFELMHILFSYYIEHNKIENIQLIVSQYYDLYQRNNTVENTLIYFKDMARYFYENSEYMESITYYNKLREILTQEKNISDKEEYCLIAYNEAVCYQKLNKVEEAYELLSKVIKDVDSIKNDASKGKVFHSYSTLCIKLKKDFADQYKKKAFEYQQHNPIVLALSKGDYGKYYFEVNEREKAINEIKEGIKIFPNYNSEKYVEFLNSCTKILIKNSEFEIASEIADESLNIAISTDNIILLKKSYYLKGTILQRLGDYSQAEKYMNISLDALFKSGTREERKERYIDMGNMYYKLGSISDSLKYFNLAFVANKKI
ncbi:helix-turn-helix domain-containing protein [Clostridium weizhouense]|uniref:Helix-turn-helix domain-containing protein n=1 Tax=Clostridium weizhouense TaxID=2859781 RepID=A0ABS7AJC2_9CLOT|nr:helix-turn-helix transcriptional regulator [Clostridium weizhouense]MBW6408649.1 helix-turn-helix domain-containing protein [Clostridium weizhouense]